MAPFPLPSFVDWLAGDVPHTPQVVPRKDYINETQHWLGRGHGSPFYLVNVLQPARFRPKRLGHNRVIPHTRDHSDRHGVNGFTPPSLPPDNDNHHDHSKRTEWRAQADKKVDDMEHSSGTTLDVDISYRTYVHLGDQKHLDTTHGFGWTRSLFSSSLVRPWIDGCSKTYAPSTDTKAQIWILMPTGSPEH